MLVVGLFVGKGYTRVLKINFSRGLASFLKSALPGWSAHFGSNEILSPYLLP